MSGQQARPCESLREHRTVSMSAADVTAVVTCFNYGRFLPEAVASLLEQEAGRRASSWSTTARPSRRRTRRSTRCRTRSRSCARPTPASAPRATPASPRRATRRSSSCSTPTTGWRRARCRAARGARRRTPSAGFAYGHQRFFGGWSGEMRMPPYDPLRLLDRHLIGPTALMRARAAGGHRRLRPRVRALRGLGAVAQRARARLARRARRRGHARVPRGHGARSCAPTAAATACCAGSCAPSTPRCTRRRARAARREPSGRSVALSTAGSGARGRCPRRRGAALHRALWAPRVSPSAVGPRPGRDPGQDRQLEAVDRGHDAAVRALRAHCARIRGARAARATGRAAVFESGW